MTPKRKDRIFMRPDSRGNGKMVATNKHHCETPRCRGVVNRKTEKSPYCTRCRRRKWKSANPLRYAFGNLRRRAKQRGKSFTLAFEEYKEFAERTDYHKLKGKSSLSLSIDRIDNSKGYEAGNIRTLRLSENSRKQHVDFYRRQFENESFVPSTEDIERVQNQMRD